MDEFLTELFRLAASEQLACVRAHAASFFFGGTGNLLRIIVMNGQSRLARHLWGKLLKGVQEWEGAHKLHVHKSIIFYHLGVAYLTMGDVDSAFTSFYAAIEEYKFLEGACRGFDYRKSPPYLTMSLDPNPENLLSAAVLTIRRRIRTYLRCYKSLGGNLKMKGFDTLFLLSKDLEIENLKRLFVHTLWTFSNLKDNVASFMAENDFARLRNLYIALSMCLIIDKVLVVVNRRRDPQGWMILGRKKSFFGNNIEFNVLTVSSWAKNDEWEDLVNRLKPSNSLPDRFVPNVLDNQGLPIGFREWKVSLLLLAWNLRNCASHKIALHNVLARRIDDIFRALVLCLFVVVEQLAQV